MSERDDTIEVVVDVPAEACPDTVRVRTVEVDAADVDMGRAGSDPGIDGEIELDASDLLDVEAGS